MAIAAAVAGGCRASSGPDGALGDVHVLAGRPVSEGGPAITTADLTAGFFVSTDDDLLPLRDWLRANLRLSGDLLGSLNLTIPRGRIERRPFGGVTTSAYTSAPVIGSISLDDLNDEYEALCEAGLRSLAPVQFEVAGRRCRLFDLGAIRDVADGIAVTLVHDEIDARWDVTSTGPALIVTLPFEGDVDPKDWVPADPAGRIELDIELAASEAVDERVERFDRYFAGGVDYSRPRLGLSVRPGAVRVTGFDPVHGLVDDQARQLVPRLIDVTEPWLRLDWFGGLFARSTPSGVVASWCAGLGAACPLSTDAVEWLQDNTRVEPDETVYAVPGGRAVALPGRGGVLDDGHVDLIALGGTPSALTLEVSSYRIGCVDHPGACELEALCDGGPAGVMGTLCDERRIVAPVSADAAADIGVLPVPASPTIGTLLDLAPGLSEQLHRVFTAPLEHYNRVRSPDTEYEAIEACPGDARCPPGVGGAIFVLAVDPDRDGVPFTVDNCPGVENPDQRDADGDRAGDACDACPTVVGTDPRVCDCDPDGDTCTSSVVDVFGAELCEPTGEVWDQAPTRASTPDGADLDDDGDRAEPIDVDQDGWFDDCDGDDDADGVRDEDDNCPYEPNAGQQDANGDGRGDACDPICPYPGAPRCDDLLEHGELVFEDLRFVDVRDLGLLAPPWCIVDGPGCWILVFPTWLGERPGLALAPSLDAPPLVIDPKTLGIPTLGGWAVVPDLDGDGRDDVVLGSPDTGEVVALSTATTAALWRSAPLDGGGAGMALVWSGKHLWVGAPSAGDKGEGAVAQLVLDAGTPHLTNVWYGDQLDGALGMTLTVAPDGGVVAGGRHFVWLGSHGEPVAAFTSPFVKAAPGHAVAYPVPGAAGPAVVIAWPYGYDRAGAVAYVTPTKARWKLVGRPGEWLGAAVATGVPSVKGNAFAIGAPGATGGGAVLLVTGEGDVFHAIKGIKGKAMGAVLGSGRDVTGDGEPDLLIGL